MTIALPAPGGPESPSLKVFWPVLRQWAARAVTRSRACTALAGWVDSIRVIPLARLARSPAQIPSHNLHHSHTTKLLE